MDDKERDIYLAIDYDAASFEEREAYATAFAKALSTQACLAHGRCVNCGGKGNHRTDPLFGDGPPNFTCESEHDVIGSEL